MKNKNLIVLSATVALLSGCSPSLKVSSVMKEAGRQVEVMDREVAASLAKNKQLVSPRTIDKGELKMVASRDWTSGFYPGELWYHFEYTKDQKWKTAAESATRPIEQEKLNGGTHDMGFKVYNSFGNALRLDPTPERKEVIIQSAKTLITRFNKKTGVLRSWDHNRDKWDYPVIIDNMLNLELLFEATRLTGDSIYHRIAVSHANTTMANHFRADNSCYHVVDYDTATGKVIKKTTHQGYKNESAWSRGQAWAVYGFTMCYRFTKDPAYLAQAQKTAAYMLDHVNMPKDLVPYWDYNAPAIPNEERDASAAAVLASGLYELADYSAGKNGYRKKADLIVKSLTNHYRSGIGSNKGFVLLHSTGSKAANSEVDVPLIYADYYYIEALLRKKSTAKYTSTSTR